MRFTSKSVFLSIDYPRKTLRASIWFLMVQSNMDCDK